MEENVALDSKKQRKFIKSIKGIKKLIKKNEGKAEVPKKEEDEPPKPFSMKLKPDGKVTKRKRRRQRGLVYLSHIPHGFYEHQMVQYFKQFGVVTNARVIRSKRTGNSKGFAFVEFKEPAVGQIVSETMNNYLMGKRLIKAVYIPPEKQKRAFRKHWSSENSPGSQLRLKNKKNFNADKDDAGELKRARKLLSNLTKTKKKLNELGINYDFFTPVDVPEALLDKIVKPEVNDTVKKEIKPKQEKNKQTNDVKAEKDHKKQKDAPKQENIKQINEKKDAKNQKKQNNVPEPAKEVQGKKNKQNQVDKKETSDAKSKGKKDKAVVKVNEKQQKDKEQKLKNAGVKPPEFIKVEEDSDDSDDSYAFDSDEYEKLLEHEDGSDLSEGEESEDDLNDDDDGDETDDDNDDDEATESNDESDDDEEEVGIPPKKSKGLPPVPAKNKKQGQVKPLAVPIPNKKQNKQQPPKQQPQKQGKNAVTAQPKPSLELKRKAPKKPANAPKNFEKQNQKPMKKQFKKK